VKCVSSEPIHSDLLKTINGCPVNPKADLSTGKLKKHDYVMVVQPTRHTYMITRRNPAVEPILASF
jgi:hypothetical protein